jgi:LysR family transcriptional regulator, cys regulon transcriptional activator
MTLLQLKLLREIERRSLNVSSAAKALNTSQPGVSRQIQMLERELGIPLLVRNKKRIVAFTPPGRAILALAKSILDQSENIELVAQEARDMPGKLVVATTHLHARYTLLHPFKSLQNKYPKMQMFLFQADPADIPRLVSEHQADIGVNTSYDDCLAPDGVICLAGDIIRRSVIMLRGHPLGKKRRSLTVRDLTAHPLVGYNPRSSAGNVIARAFKQSGVVPNVIVQANDSDIIKAYVSDGLGIGIVPSAIVDRRRDAHLCAVDVTDLFPRSTMNIIIRENMHLRSYVRDFIEMIAPNSQAIKRKLKKN